MKDNDSSTMLTLFPVSSVADSNISTSIYFTAPIPTTSSLLVTTGVLEEEPKCGVPPTAYDISLSIVAAICIFFGFFYLVLGYRLLKGFFFLTGFSLASGIIYPLLLLQAKFNQPIAAGLSITAGLLLAALSGCVLYIGYFVTGTATGAASTLFILLIVDRFYLIQSQWPLVALLATLVLVLGLLTLIFRRPLSILGTAVWGCLLIGSGIDYLLQNHFLGVYLWARIVSPAPTTVKSWAVCWQAALLLLICVVLLPLVGTLVQFKISAKTVHHRDQIFHCCACSSCFQSRSQTPHEEIETRAPHIITCTETGDRVNASPSVPSLPSAPPQYQHPQLNSQAAPVYQYSWQRGAGGAAHSIDHHSANNNYNAGVARKAHQHHHNRSSVHVDPEADKFCHLYRIRQMHGDVPSQDAFQKFQLRNSGFYSMEPAVASDSES